MKVLVVMPTGGWRGGAEWMLWHLFEHNAHLDDIEWIAAFLEPGDLADDVRALGIDTRVVPAGRMRNVGRGLGAIATLRRIARDEDVDLVVGWMANGHIYAGPAAAAARVPAMWYQLWIPEPTWIDRLATAIPARHVLACSETIGDAQRRIRPRRPVTVVYPGVNLERFDPDALPSPAEARKKLGLPTSGPLIGIAGRLQKWKGTHVLVDALPEIRRSHPDAHCVLVGDVHPREAEYGDFLRERISSLGLDGHVTLAGNQANAAEWMMAMDVVVHASDREPFGIVVPEAMALGKAVVAGAEGGPSEVITDGHDGLLVPYGDSEGMARAIVRLLDDPEFARRLGDRASQRAQDFSAHAYAAAMVRAMREVVGSGRSRSALRN